LNAFLINISKNVHYLSYRLVLCQTDIMSTFYLQSDDVIIHTWQLVVQMTSVSICCIHTACFVFSFCWSSIFTRSQTIMCGQAHTVTPPSHTCRKTSMWKCMRHITVHKMSSYISKSWFIFTCRDFRRTWHVDLICH